MNEDFNEEEFGETIDEYQQELLKAGKEIEEQRKKIRELQSQVQTEQTKAQLDQEVKKLQEQIKKQQDALKWLKQELNKADNYDYVQNERIWRGKLKAAKRNEKALTSQVAAAKAEVQLVKANSAKEVESLKKDYQKKEKSMQAAKEKELASLRQDFAQKENAWQSERQKMRALSDPESFIYREVILPAFKKQYPDLDIKNISPQKLQQIVEAAHGVDKKYARADRRYQNDAEKFAKHEGKDSNKAGRYQAKRQSLVQPKRPSQGYAPIVAECALDARSTDVKQEAFAEYKSQNPELANYSDEQIVEKIISDHSKTDTTSLAKTKVGKKVLVLVGTVAVFLIVGVCTFLGLFTKSNKDYNAAANDVRETTGIVEVQNEYGLYADNGYDSSFMKFYDITDTGKSTADELVKYAGGGSSSYTMRAATDDAQIIHDIVTDAHSKATALKNGEEHQQNLDGYNNAIEQKNVEEARTFGENLKDDYTEMKGYSETVTKGVQELAGLAGLDYNNLAEQLALLQQPTKSFTVSDSVFTQYQSKLQKGSFRAQGIESCVYDKTTGEVEILVRGLDKFDEEQFAFLTYTIDANLPNPSLSQVMAPVMNNGDYSYTVYDNTVEAYKGQENVQMNVGDQSFAGDASVQYQYSTSYNANTGITNIQAEVMVFVKGADGKIDPASTTTLKVEINVEGKVKKAEVQNLIEQNVSQQLASMLSESEAQM